MFWVYHIAIIIDDCLSFVRIDGSNSQSNSIIFEHSEPSSTGGGIMFDAEDQEGLHSAVAKRMQTG